jgi:hypothetical protein
MLAADTSQDFLGFLVEWLVGFWLNAWWVLFVARVHCAFMNDTLGRIKITSWCSSDALNGTTLLAHLKAIETHITQDAN